jgi:uncharacterized alpha-E superfamily protein
MLSRVADAFYWMSRYLERAEHAARTIDVYLSLTLDGSSVGNTLLASIGHPPAGYAPRLRVVEPASAGRLDASHRDAVAGCIVAARENARHIREQVSSEMWEQLNRMYLLMREAEQEEVWLDEPGAFVRAIVEGTHLFHGVTEATLSHDEGWHYLQIGRFIERATTTAAMLESHFRESKPGEAAFGESVEWVGLLHACGAFEAYCKHYTADLRPERIAEFLLLSANFPRSVRFVADRVEDSLRTIARALGKANGRPERFAGRLKATLAYGQIDEIMADSPLRYLENIRNQCEQVHAALYQTYITYSIEAAIAS